MFLGLNLLDTALTWVVLLQGGAEGNPVLRFMGAVSPLKILVWKLSTMAVVLLALSALRRLAWLTWVNVGLAVICAWNIVAIVWGAIR